MQLFIFSTNHITVELSAKALVDRETVDAFKKLFEGSQLSTLVALATSAFILQEKFLLIIYSDSESDSDPTWYTFISISVVITPNCFQHSKHVIIRIQGTTEECVSVLPLPKCMIQ